MCGLVGIAGDTTSHWKDTFTDLLIVDSLRGAHSTGIAAVKRFQNEVDLVKQPGGPHNLIGLEAYKKAVQHSVKAIIGHNRYATIGEHTVENAHPFAFPTIVGAHNGTLDKSAIKKLYRNELLGTDSEAIYSNINEHGLRDTVDKLSGAWALTWYDSKTNSINMLRNDRRPLWYCYSKDRCTLLWASEVAMLEFVMTRAKVLPFQEEFYQLDTDTHHQWVIPDSISKKFEPPTKVEMKAPPPPPVTYYYNGGTHYHSTHNRGANRDNVLPFPRTDNNQPTGGTPTSKRNTDHSHSADGRKKEVDRFRPPYKDAKGGTLNKKAFNKLTADGCVFCQNNNIDWGDFIKPLKSADGHPIFLCEDCYVDEEIYDLCKNIA